MVGAGLEVQSLVTKVFSSFSVGWTYPGWILGLIQGILAMCLVQGGCAELSNVCKPAATREKGCSEGLACGPCSVRRGKERTSSQLCRHGPGTEGHLIQFSMSSSLPHNHKSSKLLSFVICKAWTRTEKNAKCTKYSPGRNATQVRISLSEDKEARGMDGFCA